MASELKRDLGGCITLLGFMAIGLWAWVQAVKLALWFIKRGF